MVDLLGWLVIAFVVALYVLGLALAIFWFPKGQDAPGMPTRIMLVCLRLAIAWHFLIEGSDKIHNPNWSSEPYLREATGPLAPVFRHLAGDPLAARLTLAADDSFPDALDADWQNYLTAYTSFYRLDKEESERAANLLRQLERDQAIMLASQPRLVDKPAPYPPPLKVALTMPERLRAYQEYQQKVAKIETEILSEYGVEEFDRYKAAKADLAKWRATLQRDLAFLNKQMKRKLRALLLDFLSEDMPKDVRIRLEDSRKKIWEEAKNDERNVSLQEWDDVDAFQEKWHEKVLESFRTILASVSAEELAKVSEKATNQRIFEHVVSKRGKNESTFDPLPFSASKPVGAWTALDWANFSVKYGIFVVGCALLVGLSTRTACVAGAGFLLLFFLAMPPLPGWPEGPRAEGHYLFINKNVIEMLALLTLATTRSGRWLGFDAWLQFLCPSRWRSKPASVTMNNPTARR